MAELDDLSTTDASNTARFPENMQFRNVNDGARALEGMLAREYKDRNMSLTSTGSSNAFAVTPNRTVSSLTDGLLIGFTANHSITGAATLNVAGLGAKPIVASNGSAVSAGDIVSGQKLQVVYRSATADFQLVGDRASGTSADMTARVFPVGGIIPWPTATAPTGWLLAYGQAVSRTTYAELFAVYGTTYGSGDGSTTFNVPDYRGRSPFGKDDMGGSAASRLTSSFGLDGATLGAVGGAQSTTLSEANLAGHTHGPGTLATGAGSAHSHVMFGETVSGVTINSATDYVSYTYNPGGAISYTMNESTTGATLGRTADESAHTHSVTGGVTASTGSATAFSNVPPGIVQNWIILALPAAASAATIGVNGLLYQFSTGTSDTNPGTGKLAFNNASLSSATQLYINETDAAGAGMASVLALWDDSTSTTKGTLYVFKVGLLSSFAVFTISGSMTDAGSYDKFTLTHVASGGSFAANDQLSVLFVPKGDKGDSAVLATDTTWAAKGDLAVGTGDDTATILPVGSNGQVLTADSAEPTGVKWSSVSGSGDVTAASAFGTDNRLLRSDGTAKGAQASGVTLDDTANMSGVAVLSTTTIELGHASDTTISRTGAGTIAVEGVEVALNSASLTHIASTIELGHATDTTISRTGAGAIAVEGVGVALNSTSLAHTAGTIELGHATDTTLSRSAAGELAVEGTIVKKVGKETIWIPAAAMTARTTNGAASGITELTTNDIMLRSLDFDTTTEEGVGFMVAMPKSWNESTVTFKAFWTAASGSGGVAWGLAGYALSDDDAMDTAVSGQQIVTDTLITANDMHITSESSAITIGGTPAEGDVVYFEITREVANGSDTIAADAKLLGIHLYITTNASTDA